MDASLPSLSPDLLLHHGRFVRSLARELLADEHLAEDVVQETWLRHLRRPPAEPAATRSWLRSVARRLSIEGLRTRARSAAREERSARAEALPSTAEELAHGEVLRSVVEAVLALDEPYRTSVLLRYWRGWDARRIARETGEPLSTVRSRLQRAHGKLRERLDREHGREAWGLALGGLVSGDLASSGAALAIGGGVKLALGGLLAAGLFLYLWRVFGSPPPSGGVPIAGPVAPVQEEERPQRGAEPEATSSSRTELEGSAQPGAIRIAGTVIDRAYPELGLVRKPAADLSLTVVLASEEYGFDSLAKAETRTDETGAFQLEFSDPGSRPLFVRFSSKSDEHYRWLRYVAELAQVPQALEIFRAAHGVLRGNVVDERGAPLAGAVIVFHQADGAVRQASGDASGHFTVSGLTGFWLEARLAGYALLDSDREERLEEGGWRPILVRMGPEAAMSLRVIDPRGAGIEGVQVTVQLDPSENAVLGIQSGGFSGVRSVNATTDPDGGATLEGLWAARKLRIQLRLEGESYECLSAAGEELVLAGDPLAGRPLVIAPGEMLELEARLEVEREVAGRVVFPDGQGAPGAHVSVRDLGRGESWNRPKLLAVNADAQGRFSGFIRTSELRGPLGVTAVEPSDVRSEMEETLEELGYTAGESSVEEPTAETTVDPADVEGLRALELVLEPQLTIAGCLRDARGEPIGGQGQQFGMGHRIWAVPAGVAWHGEGVQAQRFREPGRFEIRGLRRGAYDLYASEELESFYSFENFLHRFPGIEAGAQGVDLRLSERAEVRIRVRFSGGEPASGIVLHRRFFPRDPEHFEAPRAEPVVRVRGPLGWPQGATYGFSGIGGDRSEEGSSSDGYDGLVLPEHALQPLGPGWYSIGLHVRGSEDEPGWFPQATPLLRFEPGESAIEFELLPAASMRGRVLGDAAGEFLAVSLLDDSGQAIPLGINAVYGKPVLVVDTSASGQFILHHAPTGPLRLRAGSRAELEQGLFRREIALALVPGENPPVEIRF